MQTIGPGSYRVHLVDLICGVNRKIEQSMEASLKPHGVSMEQYRVLRTLDEVNGLPMGDLATLVFVDSPTLTRIIDRMVASADVFRGPDPEDRRRVLVFISDKGRENLVRIQSIGEEAERQLVARLGERDSAHLERILPGLLGDVKPGASRREERQHTAP
jgi:DNA-binding MarR family transcriptional regulator